MTKLFWSEIPQMAEAQITLTARQAEEGTAGSLLPSLIGIPSSIRRAYFSKISRSAPRVVL